MNNGVFGVVLRREGGDHIVSVRDLPEVVTSGDDEADALKQAADAIEAAVAFGMKRGETLPLGSPLRDGERPVALSVRMAAKALVYEAWQAAGITTSELAQRMGRDVVDVRRILAPGHGTKLDQLDEAARALGRRLTIELAEPI